MVEELYHSDCFDVLSSLSDNSVDLILTDPPYGTTSIKWDSVIDFDRMWIELDRVSNPKANILLFASQPFTSLLVVSKLKWFRYELIWNKNKCGSPGLAKKRPMKVHENILLFSKETGCTYNPIMEKGEPWKRKSKNPDGYGSGKNTHGYGFGNKKVLSTENKGIRYPKSILHASRNFSAQQTVHPTQKPTNLLNWLIMTYSNSDEVVLDFTMGSGSTGVSSKLTGRKFIGIEKDKTYFDIAKKRIKETQFGVIDSSNQQLTTQYNVKKEKEKIPNSLGVLNV